MIHGFMATGSIKREIDGTPQQQKITKILEYQEKGVLGRCTETCGTEDVLEKLKSTQGNAWRRVV